jgi:hypothetical protein
LLESTRAWGFDGIRRTKCSRSKIGSHQQTGEPGPLGATLHRIPSLNV